MINIALYGYNDSFLKELKTKLVTSMSAYGHEFIKIEIVSNYQTSLFGNDVDLYIVDLTLNPEASLKFAKDINRPYTELIFLADVPAYTMEAFNLEALGYYLFPLNINKITERIIKRFTRPEVYDRNLLLFKTPTAHRVIPAIRVTHIEYSEHRMYVYLDTGHMLKTSTMRTSFTATSKDILMRPCFIRTHSSYIVNISHISSLLHHEIVLDSGVLVPISISKLSEVKDYILNYLKNYTSNLT